MMILNYKGQTMRLAFALGLAGVGFSTAKADLRYEAKGTEYDLTGKLVGDQVAARLAMGSKGGYLVWQDNATDEFGLGISALRIDVAGNSVGAPVRINSLLKGNQEQPRVGVLANGGTIFAWEGGASGFHRVNYRVANAEGLFLGEDRFVTGPESGEQVEPAIAALKNGGSVLAWTDYLEDGSVKGVSARIIGANGQAQTDAFRLNKFTLGNQHKAQVVAMPGSRFAAVWVSDQQQDAKSIDVVLRVFSATGQALTEEVIVSPLGISANPTLNISGESLVVAWEQLDLEQKINRWDIGARSFDFNLKPLSEPVLANLHRKGDQFAPQLQGGPQGAMLVWTSLGQDKSREAVMGRFINSSGRLVEGEVSVNTTQALAQMQPTLTLSTNGEFLVAWSTPNLGDTGFDVVGQRYASKEAIDLLPAISEVFVNPISETELLVSWPAVKGLDVKHYEVYFDGLTTPKLFADNHVVWPGLRPGSEYSFRVAYQLSDGRHSELSALAFSKTWGRDYNADGLPDDWQREYFGKTVTTWPEASADSDADGATNGEEFAAGTDPSDRSDSLTVSLAKLERGQRLEWNARPGALYQLQHTAALGSGSWANVGEPVLALEGRAGITLESVENMKFYRIKKIR
jgi:hypothetical protein|tara:strand:- start:549 stop:2438 length:1890 start_codon:yes stop_codon:yes gene_type:complete